MASADHIIARIIAAFARTGLVPIGGERLWVNPQNGERCGCAAGAAGLAERGSATTGGRYLFGAHRTLCVEMGWDDAIDGNVHSRCVGEGICPGCQRKSCAYYSAGAAAAVAMEMTP
jgi:hypothetical protein